MVEYFLLCTHLTTFGQFGVATQVADEKWFRSGQCTQALRVHIFMMAKFIALYTTQYISVVHTTLVRRFYMMTGKRFTKLTKLPTLSALESSYPSADEVFFNLSMVWHQQVTPQDTPPPSYRIDWKLKV